jgi:hypothetical protein
MCKGVSCTGSQHCDPGTGLCVDQCSGVTCPFGQTCIEGSGCVARCKDVSCTGSQVCDPADGTCKDPGCIGVMCSPGLTCIGGSCIDTDAGMLPDAGVTGPDASGNPSNGTPAKGCCDIGGDAPLGSFMIAFVAIAFGWRRRTII